MSEIPWRAERKGTIKSVLVLDSKQTAKWYRQETPNLFLFNSIAMRNNCCPPVNVLWHSKYWFLPIDVFISVNKRPIWIISKLEYSLLTSQDARRDRYCFNSYWANFTSFPFGALDSWELPDHDTGTFDHYTGTSGHHKDPSSHMGVLQNITVSHVTTGTLSDVVVHTSRSTPY